MLAVGGCVVLFVVGFLAWPSPAATGGHLRGASASATVIKLAMVADLDEGNMVEGTEAKPKYRSVLQEATLTLGADGKWTVQWGESHDLVSAHNEAGRGMELSELIEWDGNLYTVDDRTGIVFEVVNMEKVVPRFILMEGNGVTDKGQKSEWATVKDGYLYVGSFGKEYTNKDGTIRNRNNLWVSRIDKNGNVEHIDWTTNYELCRTIMSTPFPGYQIQEAVTWSDRLNKWLVFPRRVSKEKYNDVLDERRGSNVVLTIDEAWTAGKFTEITTLVPERGFSSVTEMPSSAKGGSNAVIALRSAESAFGDVATQTSFLSVLSLDGGDPLMAEVEVPGGHKFEGVEVIG